jgi:putative flippase GtrA
VHSKNYEQRASFLMLGSLTKNQYIRFIITGIINTIFGYSIFSLFIFMAFEYKMAIAISTIAGILFNYNSFKRIVFNNSDSGGLIRFTLIALCIYFLNIQGVAIFLSYGFNIHTSFVLIFLPTTIINYLLLKFFVFKKLD